MVATKRWEYGSIYKNYNMQDVITFKDGSIVKVHDIMDPLPSFMLEADVIFVDPPWNLTNLKTFYTKADMVDYIKYEPFYNRLFECINQIKPRILFMEIGKEYLADFIMKCRSMYKYVTFYNSSYYHKKDNKCYIVHATNQFKESKFKLDYMDEEDITAWICKNVNYKCIGDLCMGRGYVGKQAFANGRRFVGTELNPKRLAILVDHMKKERNL